MASMHHGITCKRRFKLARLLPRLGRDLQLRESSSMQRFRTGYLSSAQFASVAHDAVVRAGHSS
jgi:hypothetical protein